MPIQNDINKNPVILLVAHKIDQVFFRKIQDIVESTSQKIILVMDGVDENAPEYIELSRNEQIDILKHAVPLGIDQSIITAFNHFLLIYAKDSPGIVLLDKNDATHTKESLVLISEALNRNPNALCLGIYGSAPIIRKKFWVADKLSKVALRLTTGYAVSNIQTNFVGIPQRYISEALVNSVSSQSLIIDLIMKVAQKHSEIVEVAIPSILDSQSGFVPLLDSRRLSFTFIRFAFISVLTTMIDYLFFTISWNTTHIIFLSLFMARVAAGSFNFIFGRRWVFKSTEDPAKRAIRYAVLVFALMLISYGLITPLVTVLHIHPLLSKAIAEATIFLLSFAAQAVFVYAPRSSEISRSDWDDYYNKPYPTATFTRKTTLRQLLNIIKKQHSGKVEHICELGGANSCFYDPLVKEFPDAYYTIIDNNRRGLDLFRERHPFQPKAILLEENVLDLTVSEPFANLVYSVGLIEHFETRDTAQAIEAHFRCAVPGALVVITFPHPTLLYRVSRKIAEMLHLWRFPDERPLSFEEVIETVSKHGEVVYTTINWKVVFTQAIIAVRTHSSLQTDPK